MRLKLILLFIIIVVIGSVLLYNSNRIFYTSEVNATTFDSAKQHLQDNIDMIYKKFDSEEKIINTTVVNLRTFSKMIERETLLFEKTVNDTIRGLQKEVESQTKQLDKMYQKYYQNLDEISIKEVKYKSVEEHIKIIIDNSRHQLIAAQNQIRNKIDKWENIQNDLLEIVLELVKAKDVFIPEVIELVIKDIYFLTRKVKDATDDKINKIMYDLKLRVSNTSDNNEEEELTLEEHIGVTVKMLREVFHYVEKSMLHIDLQVQRIIDMTRDNSSEIIRSNVLKYHRIKQRIIEFVEDIETSIGDKNSLVENTARQIDKLSRLEVKLLKEEAEIPLDYDSHVPFFGILPNETLASYNSFHRNSTMINYGVRSDGSQFIREITKEEVGDKTYIQETFFDEEGQTESKMLYMFCYTR